SPRVPSDSEASPEPSSIETLDLRLPLLPRGGEGRGEEANTDKIVSSGAILCEASTPHPSPLPALAGRGSGACAEAERAISAIGLATKDPCAANRDQSEPSSKIETLEQLLPL